MNCTLKIHLSAVDRISVHQAYIKYIESHGKTGPVLREGIAPKDLGAMEITNLKMILIRSQNV